MDDRETLHRRARLRELIDHCFDGTIARLADHIRSNSGKNPNQAELSTLRKDNGPRSFGDKKAKNLAEQVGLHRRWFDMPLGYNLDRHLWGSNAPTPFLDEALKDHDTTPWSPFGTDEATPPRFEDPVPHEVALEIVGQSLNALSPLLQDAGRDALMKWVSGQTTAHQAAVTLNALLQASQAITTSTEGNTQPVSADALPRTKSTGT